MTKQSFSTRRRTWLKALAAVGVFGPAGLTGLIRKAHAMAGRPYPEGVQDMQGDVRINDVPAKPGVIVKPGDTVTTGANSRAVFVIGKDAYLVRDRSQVKINGEPATVSPSGQTV